MSVAPIEDYTEQLLKTLFECAPAGVQDPAAVVLTSGVYNSAYFEHTFLAQQMGVELVQGSDLVVEDGYVWMTTTQGLRRVDVIYRHIDDDFLDLKCFRNDSLLGVDHLMDVCRAGHVTLANAPGTGIADDKAVYAYVPDIIKYYLGEDAILPNVPTYLCSDDKQREHVLANWWSIRRKAAAARTRGCCELHQKRTNRIKLSQRGRSLNAQPRRRFHLLAKSLRRAGGERGAIYRC